MPRKPTKGNAPAARTAEASSAQNQSTNERTKPMNSIAASKYDPVNMSLVIADVTILQDEEGRYSLNDLHAASGGAKKHAPSYWMQTQQFKDLVAALDEELIAGKSVLITGIPAIKTVAGRYGGTFVVKELVYAYAMWISAAFSLRVIRAYDALVTAAKGHNLSMGMSVNSWSGLIGKSRGMLKDIAQCTDRGVAEGIYSLLLHTNRVNGIATLPLHRLAPGLRQELLDFEGGAA